MRKYFTITAFFIIAPFIFVFGLIFFFILYSSTSHTTLAYGKNVTFAALPSAQNVLSAAITEDSAKRAEKVREFFVRYKSPLADYSVDVVNAADDYGLDYRLLPAISMKESGACRVIPDNSHNCWGFGIYGTTVTRFKDYNEGIYTVSKALGTRYRDKHGLVTPEEIMSMYTPSSDGSWAKGVNFFMEQIK